MARKVGVLHRVAGLANRQGLIPQAVTVLKQQHLLLLKFRFINGRPRCLRVANGDGKVERLIKDRGLHQILLRQRQRQDDGIERPARSIRVILAVWPSVICILSLGNAWRTGASTKGSK